MRFISINKTLVNFDLVRTVSFGSGSEPSVTVTFDDDHYRTFKLRGLHNQHVLEGKITEDPVIPSFGYKLVLYCFEDGDEKGTLEISDIIGFSGTEPVTLSGDEDISGGTKAVMAPDGRCYSWGNQTFESKDAFFEHCENDRKSETERRAGA
jgi:hypothetical protein